MNYDFTSIIDRNNMDAIAVETIPYKGAEVSAGFDRIPMWVADMNFPVLPTIQEAIIERAKHPAFGYFNTRQEYFDRIIEWQQKRNGINDLPAECIGYENGVLGGVASVVRTFTIAGDAVLLHAPTYIGFTHVMEDTGRKSILSHLIQDSEGVWRMDYEDMDRKLKEYNIHLAVFCSPHNPTGRVWEPEEIEKAMAIYRQNDCIVISDEIWSDLTLEGYRHIPVQSISDDARNRTIAFYAPSKTFNLAGLTGSYHIIYNKHLRDRIRRTETSTHYNSMNVLSQHALLGAYRPEGMVWVDELRQVLTDNVDYAYHYILDHFKGIKLSRPQATYLLYLDCKEWCDTSNQTVDDLLKAGIGVGVLWQDGRPFNNPDTIRMNLALPKSRLEEAMRRLKEYVFI